MRHSDESCHGPVDSHAPPDDCRRAPRAGCTDPATALPTTSGGTVRTSTRREVCGEQTRLSSLVPERRPEPARCTLFRHSDVKGSVSVGGGECGVRGRMKRCTGAGVPYQDQRRQDQHRGSRRWLGVARRRRPVRPATACDPGRARTVRRDAAPTSSADAGSTDGGPATELDAQGRRRSRSVVRQGFAEVKPLEALPSSTPVRR